MYRAIKQNKKKIKLWLCFTTSDPRSNRIEATLAMCQTNDLLHEIFIRSIINLNQKLIDFLDIENKKNEKNQLGNELLMCLPTNKKICTKL